MQQGGNKEWLVNLTNHCVNLVRVTHTLNVSWIEMSMILSKKEVEISLSYGDINYWCQN